MNLWPTALVLTATLMLPAAARPSASPKAIAVLEVEKAWHRALESRDAKTLKMLLNENYVRIDSNGHLHTRENEIISRESPAPTHQVFSEQTVDFAGDAAVVHGVVTEVRAGRTVRERYTDVYRSSEHRWQVLSAHETTIR